MSDFVFVVFVPNGTPKYTYVKRATEKNEEKFLAGLDMPNMVLSVSGPSKTGKTALVESCLSADRIIKVSGHTIHSASGLWQSVMRWIGGPEEIEKIKRRMIKGEAGGKASAEAGVVVAKTRTEGELKLGGEVEGSTVERFSVEYFEAVIKELDGSDFVVFVDDFHYIDKEVQIEVAKSIKAISERGVRVCIASVPHRSDDMVRANDELEGRQVSIVFDYWDVPELEQIAWLGFRELGVDIAPNVVKRLATESLGSPQIMQSLCLNLCLEKNIRNKVVGDERTDVSDADIAGALERTTLQTDYSRVVEKLHAGAKERGTQRKEFKLLDGSNGDVYRATLLALVANPPRLSFDYDEIMDRVKSISDGVAPSGSSVQQCLLQMTEIARSDSGGAPVLEWDDDKLEVINPYFMFYLRSSQKLGQISKDKGGMV